MTLEGEPRQHAIEAANHLQTALDRLPPACPCRDHVRRALESLERIGGVEGTSAADRLREELPDTFTEATSTETVPATS